MERAPQFVIYALHGPYSLYLMLRYRGITLPTIANPGLEGSGLTNESKADLFDLLGPVGRAHLAPFVAIATGRPCSRRPAAPWRGRSFLSGRGQARHWQARIGVKTVRNEHELAEHLGKFPSGVRVLIQRYAKGPGEAGLFYLRMPSTDRGRILSLTIKHFPEVIGDGMSTLRGAIQRDDRARAFTELYFRRNRKYARCVLPRRAPADRLGRQPRSWRGVRRRLPAHHGAMERVFDTIAQEAPGFFVGRFDVRYSTLEEFMRGDGFKIVEYNGAAGSRHIFGIRGRALSRPTRGCSRI